jgi:predicted nucleic acid-binding Zn ribbon protein
MTEKVRRRSYPAPLRSVMSNILAGTPIGQRLREARIWTVWEEAVGPTVAGKARPVQFRDGILTVAVTSAPWLQQLTFMKKDLVAALNSRCGEELVREIFLKAGTLPKPVRTQKPVAAPPVTPLPPERIDEIREAVKDPELARLLTRLMELDGTRP